MSGLFVVTGNVYPQVAGTLPQYANNTSRAVFRNWDNNSFEELVEVARPGVAEVRCSRGCAFGDFDNDGNVNMLMINLERKRVAFAQRYPRETELEEGETRAREVESKCDRSAGSGPLWRKNAASEHFEVNPTSILWNETRLHFGLGNNTVVGVEVRWPSGRSPSNASDHSTGHCARG
jgi:enediyne biosynthesis protein E4